MLLPTFFVHNTSRRDTKPALWKAAGSHYPTYYVRTEDAAAHKAQALTCGREDLLLCCGAAARSRERQVYLLACWFFLVGVETNFKQPENTRGVDPWGLIEVRRCV